MEFAGALESKHATENKDLKYWKNIILITQKLILS